jgi:glucose/arabinose dehydrogenase
MDLEKPPVIPETPEQLAAKEATRESRAKLIKYGALAFLVIEIIAALLVVLMIANSGDGSRPNAAKNSSAASTSPDEPSLNATNVVTNRDLVWDIVFLPTDDLIFSELKGTLNVMLSDSPREIAKIPDVRAQGEGGLMGLAVDPDFKTNRFIYTCYNTTAGDIKVVRWVLKQELNGLIDRKDIIKGIPANPSGRHSGCQLAFGPDEYLWIGTGDTAQTLTPQSPQDPKSLAGKILRVDRDGNAAKGNLGKGFDARIYSYGHRNTQGIAFFESMRAGALGVSVEHGSDVDDEINPLKAGNFGWAPPDGPYNETNILMTDKKRFPDAIPAIWSSGKTTQAPSGAVVLKGTQWKSWNGAVVVTTLKAQHLKILELNQQLSVAKEVKKFEKEFGRLRALTQGPNGNLYVSTSNGKGEDRIIRIVPN